MSIAKLASMIFALLLFTTACVPPTAQIPAQPAQTLISTDNQISSSPLAFTSMFEVTEFIAENNKLIALGFFTVTDFEGNTETAPVSLPVVDMNSDAACNTLTVTLGPLDLQVLGLTVNADTVELVTVANPDKGFTGVMLCGIVETFKYADMQLVAAMLNEVLDLFG
jgi:hypothetical protein